MTAFERFLKSELRIGEHERNTFNVYGCEVTQYDDKSISITQDSKLDEFPTTMKRSVEDDTRPSTECATSDEITSYKSLLGKLLFIGCLTQPILLRITSQFSMKTNKLQFHHLNDLEARVRRWNQYKPFLHFPTTCIDSSFDVEVYTDASMWSKKDPYARGGYVVYRRSGDVVHPIHWHSRKLKSVARSSSTAEILAAADAYDIGQYICNILEEVKYKHRLHLVSDSRSVYSLTSSTKEPEERINKVDLVAMHDAFEDGSLHKIIWCPGYYNVSDALTKDNRESSSLLLKTHRQERYPHHPELLVRTTPKESV